MTVFKTYMNIIKKYKGTVILYTVILLLFSVGNMSTSEKSMTFENSKPNVFVVNDDKGNSVTDNLVSYIENNSNVVDLKNDEDVINDALFYRDVHYVIYIPNDYGREVLDGKNPELSIKSTGDYQASLAEMMLTRYLEVQNLYNKYKDKESNLVSNINDTLSKTANVDINSKLDTNQLAKTTFYFNFASYSILAVIILIICMILNSFHEPNINKRTIVSSMNYKTHNRYILIGSFVYAFVVWFVYSLISVFILGGIMFSLRGLLYVINLFLYACCSLTIAMLLGTLVRNKDAVNGVVNVVALGSSFLCGAFVPVAWLPSFVLKIAHVLPAYWYINSNELLATIENLTLGSLKPLFVNFLLLIVFASFYIVVNMYFTKKSLRK